MIRRTAAPLALVLLALVLGGCATTRNVAGEPTPKEEGAAPEGAATPPAEGAPPATQPDAPPPPAEGQVAQTPPPPPAATPPPFVPPPPAQVGFIPSGKPHIIARVERVQFPAWVERGGVRAGIKAGWAIYTSDKLTTGADGRVEIATAGEGLLKIGGNSEVEMTEAYEFTGGTVEPPLLSLRRGALAFTAPMVKAGDAGVLLKIGDAIDANVLGGQVFGQVSGDEALMALVDGAVQVSGPKLNPGTMREAQTYIRVPRSGRAQPVTPVAQERMARWLSSPQPVAGRPAISASGTWDVSLNSGYSLRQLEEMACRAQKRGYPTEIYPVKEPGKLTWYRVVVRRFASKGDAVNFIGTAKGLGSREPWVLVPQT